MEPAFDSGAIVPAFDSSVPCQDWLRSNPNPAAKSSFWACKAYLEPYVKALYDLDVLSPSKISGIEQNAQIGTWAKELLIPFFADVFGESADLVPSGATLDRPNQVTTSVNRKTGSRVGLHVDTFRMQPIRSREGEKYRCVVNIGMQPRMFVFDPRHSADILRDESVGVVPDETGSFSPTSAIRRKSMLEPLQLFAMTLQPGEAYIAPTEVIVHDGSTFGISGFGAMYTFRGWFDERRIGKLATKMA
ncbi:hypothetical protein [Natronohydrobacter thiooxidans]|uniref:hypothetical protein n=1 Tax=Natronohydrobacter thiooxidans TaxID=87172 RepID=UPI001114903C|nr:hypothetical protein [Natronohydrobacter thiooxidans]